MIPASNITQAYNLFQEHLGQPYDYGGELTANPASETDCSGLAGNILEALTEGTATTYGHPVSTESWPFDYSTLTPAAPGTVGPFGTIAIASPADAPADAVAIVAIHHGGGGASSHMNICVNVPGIGWYLMEDNGSAGVCHEVPPAISQTDSYWTDFWYLGGPVSVTTNGVDYAGGVINGADIIAAGFSFACRYLAPGGDSMPAKQLTPGEAQELQAAGVGIVSNWESTGTDALDGYTAGVLDAQSANAQHLYCGGPPDRPIYFSLDWDEAPTDDPAVDDTFRASQALSASRERARTARTGFCRGCSTPVSSPGAGRPRHGRATRRDSGLTTPMATAPTSTLAVRYCSATTLATPPSTASNATRTKPSRLTSANGTTGRGQPLHGTIRRTASRPVLESR